MLPISDIRFKNLKDAPWFTPFARTVMIARDSFSRDLDTVVITEQASFSSVMTLQQVSLDPCRVALYATPCEIFTQEFVEALQAHVIDLIFPRGLWTLNVMSKKLFVRTMHGEMVCIKRAMTLWNYSSIDPSRSAGSPRLYFLYRTPECTAEAPPVEQATYSYVSPSAAEVQGHGQMSQEGCFDLEERTLDFHVEDV